MTNSKNVYEKCLKYDMNVIIGTPMMKSEDFTFVGIYENDLRLVSFAATRRVR